MNQRRNVSNDCQLSKSVQCDNCFTYNDYALHEQHLLQNNITNSSDNQICNKYNNTKGVSSSKNIVYGVGINQCNNYSQVNNDSNATSRINNVKNETQCKVNSCSNDHNNTKDDKTNYDRKKQQ